jgi:hypothetical protein
MFSGCREDQTSADANIGGMSEGAMSWAFLETMKRIPNPTYLQVSVIVVDASSETDELQTLTDTRYCLRHSNYTQVPQLSIGLQMDLELPLVL